jgi:hypothetical protein
MTKFIGEPTIRELGRGGDHHLFRFTWPIFDLSLAPKGGEPPVIGVHGIVLPMKPEDFPMHPVGASLVHFDVGRAFQKRHRVEDSLKRWDRCREIAANGLKNRGVVPDPGLLEVVAGIVDGVMEEMRL